MPQSQDIVDIHANKQMWNALASPVDILQLRAALQAGADANHPCHHPERHPLEAAVDSGCVQACMLLVEHGATLDVYAVDDGRSLLHRAIASLSEEQRHPVIDYLLSVGANPHALTQQGQSVLEWARMWADHRLVSNLVALEDTNTHQATV